MLLEIKLLLSNPFFLYYIYISFFLLQMLYPWPQRPKDEPISQHLPTHLLFRLILLHAFTEEQIYKVGESLIYSIFLVFDSIMRKNWFLYLLFVLIADIHDVIYTAIPVAPSSTTSSTSTYVWFDVFLFLLKKKTPSWMYLNLMILHIYFFVTFFF